MIFDILSIYLFVAIIVSVYLGTYIQTRGGINYTRSIVILCYAICFYMFGYVMEINSVSYERIMFWNAFQYITVPLLSSLWLMAALMYTGKFYRYKIVKVVLLYTVPFLSIIARFTNRFFGLYFSSTEAVMLGDRVMLSLTFGPIMILQLIHSTITLIVAAVLFIDNFIHSGKSTRKKNYLMMIGSFISLLGIYLSIINPMGLNIDYIVVLLPITCLAIFISITKYDFLEIRTMAREMAFESSGDGFLLMNLENKIIDMNPKAKRIFEQLGVEISEIPIESLLENHEDVLKAISSNEPMVFNINDDNPEYYEVLTKMIGLENEVKRGYFKTLRDVTSNFELNRTLRYQASTDVLSGVLNRRAFMAIGKTIFEDKRHFDVYLLMMDLDHFKNINDKYGHMVGDEVIRGFGELLRTNFRETDVLCRLGGEEFAVMMRDTGYAAAVSKAESFRKAVEHHDFHLSGYHINITVSTGMVRANKANLTVDYLLNRADIALYQSKENGRNQVTVSQ